MLPNSQLINNPQRPTSPSEATSLSNAAPGTKSWTKNKGPTTRPANYLSRGPLKPRPKLFHGGETNFFHRMYDEAGELVGVASPQVVDGALLPHKAIKVNKGMVCGFFNTLFTDSEVATFESEHPVTPEEIAEMINLFDDECGLEGHLTVAQLKTAFKKYRHYDPNHLLRERKLMFRMREYVLTRRNTTLQKWFDSLPVKHGVKREDQVDKGVGLDSARSGTETARSDFSVASTINNPQPSTFKQTSEWEGPLSEGDTTPLAQHGVTSGGSASFSPATASHHSTSNTGGSGGWGESPLSGLIGPSTSLTPQLEVGNQVDIMVKLDEESVTLVGIEKSELSSSGIEKVSTSNQETISPTIIESTIGTEDVVVNDGSDSAADSTADAGGGDQLKKDVDKTVIGKSEMEFAVVEEESNNQTSEQANIISESLKQDIDDSDDDGSATTSMSDQGQEVEEATEKEEEESIEVKREEFVEGRESDRIGVETVGESVKTSQIDSKKKRSEEFDSDENDSEESSLHLFTDENGNALNHKPKLPPNQADQTKEPQGEEHIGDKGVLRKEAATIVPKFYVNLTKDLDPTSNTSLVQKDDLQNMSFEGGQMLSNTTPSSSSMMMIDTSMTATQKAEDSKVGVANWGSSFVKTEEHAERVGMTEFRKALRRKMGKFAFNKSEEKCFFKYMNDVQFNAYAPAEVPVSQIEASLKNADRVHLEARMSIVLRKVDRLLRFNGLGIEDFFPSRMAAGVGGFSVTGRARASPEIKYKLKHLISGFSRIVTGKSKKKNNRLKRDAHWVTFYYMFEPAAPPWDKNDLTSVVESAAEDLEKKLQNSAALRNTRVNTNASGKSTKSTMNEEGGSETQPSTARSSVFVNHSQAQLSSFDDPFDNELKMKRLERQREDEEDEINGIVRTGVLKKYGVLLEVVEERNGWPWERVVVDLEEFSSTVIKIPNQDKKTMTEELLTERSDQSKNSDSSQNYLQPIDGPVNGGGGGGDIAGLTFRSFQQAELIKKQKKQPSRIWSVAVIPAKHYDKKGNSDENETNSNQNQSRSAKEDKQKGGKQANKSGEQVSNKSTSTLLESSTNDTTTVASGGAALVQSIPSITTVGGSATQAGTTAAATGLVNSMSSKPSPGKKSSPSANSSPKSVSLSSSVSVNNAAAKLMAAQGEVNLKKKKRNDVEDEASWLARCALSGGGVAGYCFRLSHPSMPRVEAWCQTANDINKWIGCFTDQAKIPLSLHSEKLPPPEVVEKEEEEEEEEAALKSSQLAIDKVGGVSGSSDIIKVSSVKGQGGSEASHVNEELPLQKKTNRPPKQTSFMFSPAAPATTYARNINGGNGNTVAGTSEPRGIGKLSDFNVNPSRRRICCFCGIGDENPYDIEKKNTRKSNFGELPNVTAANANKISNKETASLNSKNKSNMSTNSKRKNNAMQNGEASKRQVSAAAAVYHLEKNESPSSYKGLAPPLRFDQASSITLPIEKHNHSFKSTQMVDVSKQTTYSKPAIKWGLKPREIFIACPYGLVSDLACWPCLAANSKSSHAEQQANATMPYRSHAGRFHTSETVSGWNLAPPATTLESCITSNSGGGNTNLRGFRIAMNQEPLAVKKSKPKVADTGQVKAYTSPYMVKYGQPQDIGICLDNPSGGNGGSSHNSEQMNSFAPYEPIPATKKSLGLLKHEKPKAVEERSETEEGWIRESEDDKVLDSRFDLDLRLAWINETATRIAPLVKAQFRRALVQDRELKRRRKRLEKRAAELVEIKGGIGTGVISGEAWIPALPTLTELSSAKNATELAFKNAMRTRSYLRVTSLEEQLVAIESRQVKIGREEKLAAEAHRLALEEARRPKARPIWDKVEGEFRRTKPLLRTLKHHISTSSDRQNNDNDDFLVDEEFVQFSSQEQKHHNHTKKVSNYDQSPRASSLEKYEEPSLLPSSRDLSVSNHLTSTFKQNPQMEMFQ